MQPDEKTGARRERMAADQRQHAILDAAAQILATHGWDEITVNEILAAAGISKGGFYHHFSSKDDILAALVLRFADAATAAATAGQGSSGAGFVDRLSAYLCGSLEWELDHAGEVISIVRLAQRAGNGALFLELARETERRTLPALKEILSEGLKSGAFEIEDVDMTADLILRISRTRWLRFIELQDAARAGDRAAALADLHRRRRAEQQAYERLLDFPSGSIQLPPESAFERILR
ncbi:TetR/AcrR family transcriptional regulator [uncultured Paracoccus sp.]|uniref:TetR/AcrR family transcriptional regulator n=1 Tax=uncultured Paracoccus sp. TaxID=189685 RepID=UPI00260E6A15|nr:TetR/AcrR family transcriptional regulator [uncultured Paracoccus sp.]